MAIKRTTLFFKIYVTVIALVIVATVTGAIILSNVLKSYEATRPIHLAEEIFETYFKKGDYLGALKLADVKINELDTLENAAAVMKDTFSGKDLILYEITAEDGFCSYAVAAVDKTEESEENGITQTAITSTKIATLNFTETEEEASWGFDTYKFAGMDIEAKGSIDAEIKVPSDVKVYANGIELGEEYLSGTEESENNAHLPENAAKLVYNIFKVSDLFAEPKFTAKDQSGAERVISGENGSYTVALLYSDELKAKYGSNVLKGIEMASAYIQADASSADVAAYFDTSSAYYREVRNTPTQFVWDHNGYSFENEVCDEFYAYDENTFSCHISFKHVLKKKGQQDFIDIVNVTVFCKKIGNSFKIYDHIVR